VNLSLAVKETKSFDTMMRLEKEALEESYYELIFCKTYGIEAERLLYDKFHHLKINLQINNLLDWLMKRYKNVKNSE
jgi:hypothetical protein